MRQRFGLPIAILLLAAALAVLLLACGTAAPEDGAPVASEETAQGSALQPSTNPENVVPSGVVRESREVEFASVSAGGNHTCGVRTDGIVECWGYDVNGAATPPEGAFDSVSAGADHTCGVRTDGAGRMLGI